MKQLRLTIAMLITLCLLLACDPGLPFTVTYNSNGADSGSAPVDGATYHQYDAVTVTDGQGSLVKAGYNLAGWMTAVDGTGTSYAPGAVFAMGAGAVTLHAVWVPMNFTYESSGTSITLLKYSLRSVTTLDIPAGVTGLGSPYAILGEGVLQNCTMMTSITSPASLTSIGNNAFFGCTGLTSLTFPSVITSIGVNTFLDCTSLTSITIPTAVTSIGQNAFNGCTGLATVTVMPTTPPTLGTTAFTGLPGGYQLKVPAGTVATYQAAANWITWQANIVSQ
jgi:hypothetical protein